MIRVNMVIASNETFATRIFIGDTDTANEFASFLSMSGWSVRTESGIDPRTQPRILEEEEVAAALVASFEQWKMSAQGDTL